MAVRATSRFVLAWLVASIVACEDSPPQSFEGGDVARWSSYGATPGGTHYSPASQITPRT